MPGLTIPDEDRPGLQKLARLDEDNFTQLATAVERAPLRSQPEDLTSVIAAELKGLPQHEIASMVESVRQLAMVRAFVEVPLEQFIVDVADAMSIPGDQEGETRLLEKREIETLTSRLTKLLSTPSIEIPSKARSLMTEHENSFCEARILTDIRPVFGSDVLAKPSTAVLMNTLKISYHHGTSLRSFFVILKRDDLDQLSELIDRAKAKTETLHRFLSKAQLEPID